MSAQARRKGRGQGHRRWAAALLASASLGCLPCVYAAAQDPPAPAARTAVAPAPARPPQARGQLTPAHKTGIDGRVELLARELGLDAGQQAQVRAALLQQQVEVRRAWSDESQPAPLRVAATRAIGDRTAERIRSILTDEQREKYLKARPQRPQDQTRSTVDSWISAVGNH